MTFVAPLADASNVGEDLPDRLARGAGVHRGRASRCELETGMLGQAPAAEHRLAVAADQDVGDDPAPDWPCATTDDGSDEGMVAGVQAVHEPVGGKGKFAS